MLHNNRAINEGKNYFEFASLASTYRPPELGSAEVDMLYLFAQGKSLSAYDILKKKREESIGFEGKPKPNYKDVHKRVQRLAELKLIEPVTGLFKRRAKYYKITSYGLITSLDKSISANTDIVRNSDNFVIRELLSEFFEPGTIQKFEFLEQFPARNLKEYLHDCCSRTTNICRSFWTRIERTKVIDILPSHDVIQKYMLHLAGEPVEKYVLDEIEEYEKRLKKKVKVDESLAKAVDEHEYYEEYLRQLGPEYYSGHAPFPFTDMYESVAHLAAILEEKRGFFVFGLVTALGERVKAKEALQKDFSLYSILNDKRFCKLVTELKEVFDIGYKEFSQNEPKQESSNNKHPYGCHEDWDICNECIDRYEELHPKQEVKPPEAHKCVPFCDQLKKKHIGIHRAMSLEGRSVENYKVNTTARQAKSKVKKGDARTKIQAKQVTRESIHQVKSHDMKLSKKQLS
jgi:hypothetical protein